ncbi:MAG: TetR/AcrR family transcriptional regulator [Polyangiaceae bacterium]|nr:TetR/AcrR family transcriptional regulator [Polyangiaceae bacterium]
MGSTERRWREKQERRISILGAADEVVRKSGVADATMDDIARAAEVSKGTLYLYFESKDHLFLAVANRSLQQLLEVVAEQSTQGSGIERTERLLKAYARFAADNGARFRTVIAWMFSHYSVADDSEGLVRYRELVGQLFERLADSIEAGRQDGTIDADVQPAQLVFQLWAGTYGMLAANDADVERFVSRLPEAASGAFSLQSVVLSFVDSILRSVRVRGRLDGESGTDGDFRPVGGLRSGIAPAPTEEHETPAAVGFE